MARIARLPARFVFAAAVLGSLAFGATQAFAAPPTPSPSETRFCDDGFCAYACGGLGYCLGAACVCY